jgi:hypothetical protein
VFIGVHLWRCKKSNCYNTGWSGVDKSFILLLAEITIFQAVFENRT